MAAGKFGRQIVGIQSAFGLLALVVFAPAIFAQSLHLSSEIIEQAKLESLTAEGWKFDRMAPVSQGDLVRWGAWPGILKQQAVWLSDGSWIAGEIQIEGGQSLTVENDWLSVPALELNAVRGLLISPPASSTKWSQLRQAMDAATGEQDIVWLRSGQRISGVVRWKSSASTSQLILESRDQEIVILMEDVTAIVFSPALLGPVSAMTAKAGTMGLRDGTLLQLSSLRLESNRVECQVPSGLKLQGYDVPSEFAAGVCYLTGQPESVLFLGAREPASYRNLSDNSLQWELGKDEDVYGEPLIAGEGFITRGLALHSSSQVAYRWTGAKADLVAEVTLAPRNPYADARLGSVTCQILLARDGALEKVDEFELARQTGESPTVELVDIDVTGAQLVVLVVEKNDFGQYGDQVFWLDARIAKRP